MLPVLPTLTADSLRTDDVETIPQSRGAFSANVSARDMWEYYLAPFHDCVKTAKAMHVMTVRAHPAHLLAAPRGSVCVDCRRSMLSTAWRRALTLS